MSSGTDLIRFIPAGREPGATSLEKTDDTKAQLSGEEVRKFYETLCSNESVSADDKLKRKWRKTKNQKSLSKSTTDFDHCKKEKVKEKRKKTDRLYEDTNRNHNVSLKPEYEQGCADLERKHNKGCADMERKHNKGCADLERKHNKDCADLERKHNKGCADLERKHNKGCADLDTKMNQPMDPHRQRLIASNQNKLLSFCQNGELESVKKLLETDSDIHISTDYQDRYGWTALMCASVSGHKDIVKYLLSKGASKTIVNFQGKSAADLAQEIGAISIRDMIYMYRDSPKINLISVKKEVFYCEVCKCNFKESSERSHCCSTAHLVNLKLKPKPDPFLIPESNVGYQLMKQSGWDGEKGLGSKGQGRRYPVKTKLKRDRQCLGTKEKDKIKAKCTHFGPNDINSVKFVPKHSKRIMSARKISKFEKKIREKKDKQWERSLRLYMNTE